MKQICFLLQLIRIDCFLFLIIENRFIFYILLFLSSIIKFYSFYILKFIKFFMTCYSSSFSIKEKRDENQVTRFIENVLE